MTIATTAPVTAALTALYAELAVEIPDVLSTPFTFATLWADLARLAGEPVPRDVAAVRDAPLALVPVLPLTERSPLRGSYCWMSTRTAAALTR